MANKKAAPQFAPIVAKSELTITGETTSVKLLRQLEDKYIAANVKPADLQRETKNLWIEHQAKTLDQRIALGERFFVLKGANGKFWKGTKMSFKKWLKDNGIARATAYRYIDDYLLNTLRKYGKKVTKKSVKYDKDRLMFNMAKTFVVNASLVATEEGMSIQDVLTQMVAVMRTDADLLKLQKGKVWATFNSDKPTNGNGKKGGNGKKADQRLADAMKNADATTDDKVKA